ncbi:CRAL-TRIO domain-containing protein [Spinellus fusiger]|nr:CRAL-TRIO domain-containing protein [Spinellus fusiger]
MHLFRSKPTTTTTTTEAEAMDLGPVVQIPIAQCPEGYTAIENAALDATQQATHDALRAHVDTIMVASDHDYYESEKGFLTSATLNRYLRARKWDLEASKAMLENTIKWRRDFRPEQLDPDYIRPEAETGKMYFNGYDKCGRPIWIMQPRNQNSKDGERQVKHIVFCLERGIRLMPKGVEKIIILIDFKDAAAAHNPSLATSKKFLDILGSHYPERLGAAFIIKSPWFFHASFKLVAPFIDPVTKAKIKFVRDSDKPKEEGSNTNSDLVDLVDYISADQLECPYGGNFNFQFNIDAYWSALLQATGNPYKTIDYM